MGPVLLVIYLFLCVILALMGRKSTPGFWGVLFLAVFFTPIIVAFFLNVSRQVQVRTGNYRTKKAEKKAAKNA